VLRVHEALELRDVDFSLPVRPIVDFVDHEVAFDLDGLGKSFFRRVTKALTKIHKKIYHATVPKFIRDHVRRVGKRLKKDLVKFGPFIAIAAQILNFIPGLGVLVGLAIMAAATAISVGATVVKQQEAKKAAKKEEAAAAAEDAAAEAAEYKDAGAKADEAYAKGAQQLFIPKYGMTQDKWSKLTSKDKISFLNGVVFDAHPEQATQVGITRDQFNQLLPEEQVAVLAKFGGLGDEFFDESSPLTYVAIGATALAIVVVVYLVTRRKKKA
jgi:hypothetical protein